MKRLIVGLTAVLFFSASGWGGAAVQAESDFPQGIVMAKKDKEKEDKLEAKEKVLKAKEEELAKKEEQLVKKEEELKKREAGLKSKSPRTRPGAQPGKGSGTQPPGGPSEGFGPKAPLPPGNQQSNMPATKAPTASVPATVPKN